MLCFQTVTDHPCIVYLVSSITQVLFVHLGAELHKKLSITHFMIYYKLLQYRHVQIFIWSHVSGYLIFTFLFALFWSQPTRGSLPYSASLLEVLQLISNYV